MRRENRIFFSLGLKNPFILPQSIKSINNNTMFLSHNRYSSDIRLTPLHEAGSADYSLGFSNLKLNDTGNYDCQVGSDPEQFSRVKLIVMGKIACSAVCYDVS